MAFAEIEFEWNGRRATATVPPPLAGRDFGLPVPVARATERAVAALQRSSDQLPSSWEPLARLLLRTEGIASSAFEQIRAPLEEIATAELLEGEGASAWVVDNLAVVSAAIDEARETPLTIATLHDWHRRLMEHAAHRVPGDLVGTFRDRPEWVGGSTPLDAAFVAPPPELVPDLMADLLGFANGTELDPITQAAVVHAQFETIHPYGDGNGRLGRVLIGWLFVRRLGLNIPPPFSVFVARDPGGYLSGLTLYRLGELDRWVAWFARTVERSARVSRNLVEGIEELVAAWRTRVVEEAHRRDGRVPTARSTLWQVLDQLPGQPVLSAPQIARDHHITDEAARQLISRLAAIDILEPIRLLARRPGRPVHWWVAREVLDTVTNVGAADRPVERASP